MITISDQAAPNPEAVRYGHALRDAIRCAGLNQTEFAKRVHSSKPVISMAVNGHRLPARPTAERFADYLADATEELNRLFHAAWASRALDAPGSEDASIAVQVDSIHSMSNGWFHAFAQQDMAAAAALAGQRALPSDSDQMDALFAEQLALGAYALTTFNSSASIVLACFNRKASEVVIRDISIIDKTDDPIVEGAAFWIESGGWNEDLITFFLDNTYPKARHIIEGINRGLYFDSHSIRIAAGGHTVVPIMVQATRASHTFTLRISYDINGERSTYDVDNSGQPFRISPMIVHGGEPVDALPAAEREHLRSLTYLEIYLMHYDQNRILLQKCAEDEFPGYWRFDNEVKAIE